MVSRHHSSLGEARGGRRILDVTSGLEVRDRNGEPCHARLLVKYERVKVLPPVGKQRRYPELTLTVIHAIEQDTPPNREAIEWKLITDLPVDSLGAAIEKLDWESCSALEDRSLSQDPEIGVQGGGVQATNRRPDGTPHSGLLCPELADLLTTMINRTAPEAPAGPPLTTIECRLRTTW